MTSAEQLGALCEQLRAAPWIAFDTEFVSEHSYRPVLCLVQVAIDGLQTAIDPLAVTDMKPFWQEIVRPTHTTIVHAGREELLFCRDATGENPANLFDVQLAAGMIGLEYPSGYGNLVSKLLGLQPQKGETRTDWRVRPLTGRQIAYALEDVKHLQALHDKLRGKLTSLRREGWFAAEMADWQVQAIASRDGERWRKVSGAASLNARCQAIVRELWRWREKEAARRDRPARQVLRDDLIVEMAKRKTPDPRQIRAVRGMERGDLLRAVPALSEAIAKALALADDECPAVERRDSTSHLSVAGQFLTSALSGICHRAEVAACLVGTAQDVRDLVAHRLGERGAAESPPLLTTGWRAEVVGNVLDQLLEGKLAMRIVDPRSEQPLAFEQPRPSSD